MLGAVLPGPSDDQILGCAHRCILEGAMDNAMSTNEVNVRRWYLGGSDALCSLVRNSLVKFGVANTAWGLKMRPRLLKISDGVNRMAKQDNAAATAGTPDPTRRVREGGTGPKKFDVTSRRPQLPQCPKFQQEDAAIARAPFLNTSAGSRRSASVGCLRIETSAGARKAYVSASAGRLEAAGPIQPI